jgi:H+-translocating NAD(P) transhydrogenase subunit alpha
MTTHPQILETATELQKQAQELTLKISQLTESLQSLSGSSSSSPFMMEITALVLAIFVGYYVVWRVTPALHSPLMAVTNAISSVIIVGALIAAGPASWSFSKVMGILAVILASINIFGGFVITDRMLSMFRKKGK